MGFLAWHYTDGLVGTLNFLSLVIDSVFHNFSFLILLKSLFAPWKRMLVVDSKPGFNLNRFFENLSFNLISRGVGFCVRLILIFAGLILTVLAVILSMIGILIWVVIPLVGIPGYLKYRSRPELFVGRLIEKLSGSKSQVAVLFDNEAGRFVLTHCGVSGKDLLAGADPQKIVSNFGKAKSYAEILQFFGESEVWSKDFLRGLKTSVEDLVFAANWWDKKRAELTGVNRSGFFARPSLGLELLYGYTPYLNQYTTDLSYDQDFSHHLIGREKSVLMIERVLNAGNSVVLTGSPGVGKKTVALEFARRAYLGKLSPEMAYRRILEFDYNLLLAAEGDLNAKKTWLASALQEAAAAGNVILVIRDIHRLTNPSVEGYDFTDIFEKYLEKKQLKIIAILTNVDYERFVTPNLRLRKFLERVEVFPATKEEALLIIRDAADEWEGKRKIVVTTGAIKRILDGSDKYISETPFPEKALEILDAVIEYDSRLGDGLVLEDDVNIILAEKTGISFARLTEREKGLLSNLEALIHERLINQENAVRLIAQSLRSRTVGVTKEDRPVGSFLFLGPTGVGKTETAKVLAKIYYGSEDSILRFDMAQFSSGGSLERLIGSVASGRPGDLSTAIKNSPASLLLLDEIEKGGRDVHNLLLTMLDEGYLVDAFGKKINCRHLFVIGTSNAAAEYIRELVNEKKTGEQLQQSVVEHVLKKELFYPEFLNRFDGVVVYEPLSLENTIKIAHLMLASLKDNLSKKGINLEITEEAAKKLAVDGFDPAFGARPMRRIVDLNIGDLLGSAILSGNIKEGNKVSLLAGSGKAEFKFSVDNS